jgi:hypothetical protein
MSKKIGLWIDHDKAVIVFATDHAQERKQINSNIKKHNELSSKSWPAISAGLNAKYYDKVVASIYGAELIFISGLDEARSELEKRLVHRRFKGRVVDVEPDDNTSNPFLVA